MLVQNKCKNLSCINDFTLTYL